MDGRRSGAGTFGGSAPTAAVRNVSLRAMTPKSGSGRRVQDRWRPKPEISIAPETGHWLRRIEHELSGVGRTEEPTLSADWQRPLSDKFFVIQTVNFGRDATGGSVRLSDRLFLAARFCDSCQPGRKPSNRCGAV